MGVVVAVEGFHDGEPGVAQESFAFGGVAVVELASQHAPDRVDLAGRGPRERVVDGRGGDEQASGVGAQAFDAVVGLHGVVSPCVGQWRKAMSYPLEVDGLVVFDGVLSGGQT